MPLYCNMLFAFCKGAVALFGAASEYGGYIKKRTPASVWFELFILAVRWLNSYGKYSSGYRIAL